MTKHLTLLLFIGFAYSTIINIPSDYSTIQQGISASNDGDTVLVAEGEYHENLSLTKEIVLASHAIYEDLNESWNNNEVITNTIINGTFDGIGGSCIAIAGNNISPTIFGFTFTNGRGSIVTEQACGPQTKFSGGAILIYMAYPIINYNRFVNNGTDNFNMVFDGGAIVHYDDDDVEFDEDRNTSYNRQNIRTRPTNMNFQYNYFSNNAASSGLDIFSYFNGTIDVNYSIFGKIDCATITVNDHVLGTRGNTIYSQENIYGDCIENDTIYVSSTIGQNSNDGSLDSPLKTINHALESVRYVGPYNGSTTVIKVGPGLYSKSTNGETFPLLIKNNTHLIGESMNSSVLDAQADSLNQNRVIEIYDGATYPTSESWTADNILIENFTIMNGYHANDLCKGGGAILIGYPDYPNDYPESHPDVHPILKNLRLINNTSGQGALFSYHSNFTLSNSEIINNHFSDFAGFWTPTAGIGINGGSAYLQRVLVKGHSTGWAAITLNYVTSISIINSTIVENRAGIFIDDNTNFSYIYNSIVYDNEVYEIYGDSTSVYYSNIEGGYDGEGNIDTDPLFIASEYGDYRLQHGSPCINAGIADLDGDGNEDIIDYNFSDPDIGVFEYYYYAPDGFELNTQNSYIEITWNAVNNENIQYYVLERSINPDFTHDIVSNYLNYNAYDDYDIEYDTEYFYRVSYLIDESSDYSEVLSVTLQSMDVIDGHQLPKVFALHQNYPNPFNPVTTLRYELPENVMVNIIIYDMLGNVVNNLISTNQSSGYKSIQWNATNNQGEPVSAGVYLYKIQAGDFVDTKKMILLK